MKLSPGEMALNFEHFTPDVGFERGKGPTKHGSGQRPKRIRRSRLQMVFKILMGGDWIWETTICISEREIVFRTKLCQATAYKEKKNACGDGENRI